MTKILLDVRTINAVLEALNQTINNATEACAIVRNLAIEEGFEFADDPEIAGGDFDPFLKHNALVARAVQAVTDLENWCHVNEAEFSGWGDGEIPEAATRWTAQAKQAIELIEDKRSPIQWNDNLADALDAFGDSAFSTVIHSEQRIDISVISALSQGFAAVAAALREGGAK